MARGTTVVLASAARTVTGQSSGVPQNTSQWSGSSSKYGSISLMADVTAASGTTPTLDIAVEWSHDNSTWFASDPADTMTQITTTGKAVKNFTVKGQYFRLNYTIGGTTPSFTFSVRSQGWEQA